MRIADKMAFEQVNSNIGKNRGHMSELQNQAATQKRVTKPSARVFLRPIIFAGLHKPAS